jgi:hypothetical protein
VSKDSNTANALADFVPTYAQVSAAERLLVAQARLDAVAPIVDAYEREILERHQWRIDPKYLEKGCADQVILDPAHAYLLNERDVAVYFAECEAAAAQAGLLPKTPGNCPKLEAKDLVRRAENALLDEMSAISGLEVLKSDQYFPRDLRAKTIELHMGLLAPYLRDAQTILNEFKERTPKLPKMG